MYTPVAGNRVVYLYRVLSKAATNAATQIAFTTENSTTYSADADSTVTKDGVVRAAADPEVEISATSVLTKGATIIDDLKKAMINKELIEIWEANLDEPGSGDNKFKGTYYQGYLTEFEKTSEAEGNAEVSLTFGVNGSGADGDVTVTTEQQALAAYVFKDTTVEAEE